MKRVAELEVEKLNLC